MSGIDLKNILLRELDYAESPGFEDSSQRKTRRSIPGIDNIYFIQDVPVVYFGQFREVDPSSIWKLYRQVWSQSKVPLLYIILPEEIRIYNGYAEPPKTPEELDTGDRLLQNLQRLVDEEGARKEIRNQLYGQYNRLYLETGAFWSTPDGLSIRREKRADQRLLSSMNQVRLQLIKKKLPSDLAYALLGRSIFIRYLEDRGILTSDLISDIVGALAENYRSVLNNHDTAYKLFRGLSHRFHGDLFPVVEEESKIVQQDHLNLLADFLEGYDFDTGQRSFWPYDFTYIPIELISGIYDTFLYGSDENGNNDNVHGSNDAEKNRRQLGAYYTPLSLVDFIVEETLPLEVARYEMKILDPTCGSGVFLVRAYQRLVEAWKQEFGTSITVQILSDILKRSIFGVDVELNAIKIAAFSLYLAMLDFLENEQILDERFLFPSLKDTNLISADFFSIEVEEIFSGKKFDRVIGNLPWGRSTLNGDALRRVEEGGLQIGGKQIVHVFLQYAPKFCAEDGELALLAPAKSTILVASNTLEEFRQKFFQQYNVRAVVNFSALVYELFVSSLSPVVALFYRSGLPFEQSKLVYGVPKPSPISQHLGAIVLDTTEVKYLDKEELINNPILWKVASWGTSRDAMLIQRLRSFPTLQSLEKANPKLLRTEIREGYIKARKGIKSVKAPWLYEKPLLDIKDFKRYVVETRRYVTEIEFERPRSPEIYTGPLALIHKSTCEAAFFDKGFVAYRNKITGIAGQPGQENLLKWLVAYINSPLAKYYHFLTSTSWVVERGTIIHDEYKQMPFLVPSEDEPLFKNVLQCFDRILELNKERDILFTDVDFLIEEQETFIANLVFDLYGLSEVERQLVRDIVNYEIEFFYWAKRKNRRIDDPMAKAVRRPNSEMLIEYAQAFVEIVNALLKYQDQTLNAVVYQDGLPLSAVGFQLVKSVDAKNIQLVESSSILRATLRDLDKLLLTQRASTLYMRRHVRIYDGPWLYLVRPSERRFWTRSQALADADSFIVELLNLARKEVGASH